MNLEKNESCRHHDISDPNTSACISWEILFKFLRQEYGYFYEVSRFCDQTWDKAQQKIKFDQSPSKWAEHCTFWKSYTSTIS